MTTVLDDVDFQDSCDCGICYESVLLNKKYRKCKTCNTIFHSHCINNWWKKERKNDKICPYCQSHNSIKKKKPINSKPNIFVCCFC